MAEMTHWNRLATEIVDAPSLEGSKARLDEQDLEQPGLGEGAHGRGPGMRCLKTLLMQTIL